MDLPDSEARGKQHSSYAFCILPYEEPIEICMAPSPVFSPSKKIAFLTQTSFFLLIFYTHSYTQSNKIHHLYILRN